MKSLASRAGFVFWLCQFLVINYFLIFLSLMACIVVACRMTGSFGSLCLLVLVSVSVLFLPSVC